MGDRERSSPPAVHGCRTDAAVDDLLRRRSDDGGWPERPAGAFRPDATAWAALALAGRPGGMPAVLGAAGRLAEAQRDDGSVPVAPSHPDAIWPTPLALLAWRAAGVFAAPRDRGAGFLLGAPGAGPVAGGGRGVLGHDTTIAGWPWTTGTHPWVEPTSLAILALRGAGYGAHPRVAEAVRLLMDRQLPRGGWNYGNTTVYGAELEAQADTTGAALSALRGLVPGEAVSRSVTRLEAALGGTRTPLSLAWGVIGLTRWGRRPGATDAWIDACLARGEEGGGLGTTELAILLVAVAGGEVLGS